MKARWWWVAGLVAGASLWIGPALQAAARFAPPDFGSGHQLPSPTNPNPVGAVWSYLDVGVLVAALAIASWIAMRSRSRNWMFALSVFSVAYFGFYREGCVCPIGAIQNVSLALADSSYTIPITILAFFLAPLVFTLMFGRVFCAGVCPLGAIQDLVLIRPVKVPAALEQGLGVLAYAYLGAAVAAAASGSAFLICEYDPFVGFFRFSAELSMIVLGAAVLGVGLFVGRPYCRFVCPYGAILRQLSRLSWRHVTIAPHECIQCRLCHEACPFGAIDEPVAAAAQPQPAARRRVTMLAGLAPLILAGGAALGFAAGFGFSGILVGGFIGLVVTGRLMRLSMPRHRDEYNANRAACYSCMRCIPVCPKHRAESAGGSLVPLPVLDVSTASRGDA